MLAGAYRERGGVWARTAWVPEYGREYIELKWRAASEAARLAGAQPPALGEIVWTTDDFDAVAREQTRRENQAAATGSPLLICDTDAFATAVWELLLTGPLEQRLSLATRTIDIALRHRLSFGEPLHGSGFGVQSDAG
jgi:HTH-type transcriptional repressor of NAD biosynthesis genes